ncbi:MAG: lytic transglycosylase domain-containing protein [Thermoanaerobacteraceae bacterium]
MAILIDQFLQNKFKEIQSRLPSNINFFNEQNSFEVVLNNINNSGIANTFTNNNSAISNYLYSTKKATNSEIQNIINETSAKYGIDSSIIYSVIKAESNFDQFAISKAGAMGLMQLMPETAKQLNITNPFDASQNIDGGVRYLKGLLDTYKSLSLALSAYNAGPSAVNKYNGIPPYEETKNYVSKILNDLQNNKKP